MTVSIVLLCWNQAKYVEEALISISDQTSKDFNLFIIDNGSTDDSQKAIRQSTEKLDLEATLIFNEMNLGISAALNSVLDVSKDDFFVPFAADDIMKPFRIEHQQELFRKLDSYTGVLASSCQVFYDGGSLGHRISYPNYRSMGALRRSLIRGTKPPAPAAMIRTEVLRRIGGYDPACPFEDYDTWIRLVFSRGLSIHADSTVVSLYRRHPASLSQKPLVMAAGCAYSLARLKEVELSSRERKDLRRSVANIVLPPQNWAHLLNALLEGDVGSARVFALRSMFERGLRVAQRLRALVAVLLPRLAVRRIRESLLYLDSSN